MRIRLITILALVCGFVGVRAASAQTSFTASPSVFAGVTFAPADSTPEPPALPVRLKFNPAGQDAQPSTQPVTKRTVAFEYSDGYKFRAKIHRYTSYFTLPLFALEGYFGQSLYNHPTQGMKSAHLAVASGIGTLFAVNAATGIWNIVQARHDPNGKPRRTVHGVLMIAAAWGFVATAATAPESELGENGQAQNEGGGSRSLHRGIAFTSIGLAAASYLIMLFGK